MEDLKSLFTLLTVDGLLRIEEAFQDYVQDEIDVIGVKMDLFKKIEKMRGSNLKFRIESSCGGAVRKAVLTDDKRKYRKALHVMKSNQITNGRLRLELAKDYCHKFGIRY